MTTRLKHEHRPKRRSKVRGAEWPEDVLQEAWMFVNASRIDEMDEAEELILQRVEERLDERLNQC